MACPFLDEADGRCSGHMSLNRLDEALRLCCGERFEECPVYQEKSDDDAGVRAKREKFIAAG